MKRKLIALTDENLRYRELLTMLRAKPEEAASDIFWRIRASPNPLLVLEEMKQASSMFLDEDIFASESHDEELANIDTEAWESSPIKVPAKPWTSVVKDGLASELISSYFTWENTYFFPSIHQKTFIEEMTRARVDGSDWCTPFLVNSICAQRAVSPTP